MGGGSRGKSKVTLRDLSRIIPTHDETTHAILTAASSDSPIATAIIGATIIERELEVMLRVKFSRKDDETWKRLTEDNGPLSTLHRKIVTAHAMNLFSDAVKNNLDIIRKIRNAFAHSKIILLFENELILAELRSISFPPNKHGRLYKSLRQTRKLKKPKDQFLSLCLDMAAELIARQNRGMAAGTRNLKRRIKRLEQLALTSALLHYQPGLDFIDLPAGWAARPGLLSAFPAKNPSDNEGR